MLPNNKASTMSSSMIEDLEELDYMREGEGGMWEGGSEESSAEDSVSIHTFFRFFE